MAQTIPNVRLYRQYTDDGEIFVDNGTNDNDQLQQPWFSNILQNFTESVVNASNIYT